MDTVTELATRGFEEKKICVQNNKSGWTFIQKIRIGKHR